MSVENPKQGEIIALNPRLRKTIANLEIATQKLSSEVRTKAVFEDLIVQLKNIAGKIRPAFKKND